MIRTIQDVSQIQTGIWAKPVANGEVYYVQARHFDQNREFVHTIPELAMETSLSNHILRPGDVLIAAKGYDHFAVAYQGNMSPAVASSMFIVVRPEKMLLPAYLAWYINHPKTQYILSSHAKGTALPSLTKKDIGNLEILIPSIRRQEIILKIEALTIQEKQIRQQIETLNETRVQQLIFNAINTAV